MPFVIENCDLIDAFNYYLTDVQRFYAYQNKSNEMKKMIDRIKALTDGETNERANADRDRPIAFDVRTAKTFASCGMESTIFKTKRSEDGGALTLTINFEKTRIREVIPEFAGAYYLNHPPVDISNKKKIVFEACSPDGTIEPIWVEIKPENKAWMHESFEFELSSEMTAYEIDIDDFEYPDTRFCFEEITFVVKTVSFTNDDSLKGTLSLGNIEVL